MIPSFRGRRLPAISPSICSNAAANISLASLIILCLSSANSNLDLKKQWCYHYILLNDTCFPAGVTAQGQITTPLRRQLGREIFWTGRAELPQSLNTLWPTVYWTARPHTPPVNKMSFSSCTQGVESPVERFPWCPLQNSRPLWRAPGMAMETSWGPWRMLSRGDFFLPALAPPNFCSFSLPLFLFCFVFCRWIYHRTCQKGLLANTLNTHTQPLVFCNTTTTTMYKCL